MPSLQGFWTLLLSISIIGGSSIIVNGSNILITVVGLAGSQNLVMYRLAELMGERGHNVTVLNAILLPGTKSIPLKYGKEISYELINDNATLQRIRSTVSDLTWSQSENSPMPIGRLHTMFSTIRDGCERFLDERQDVIDELKSFKFDTIVLHMADFCGFGLTRVLAVDSYVWMSTAFMMDPMAYYSGSPLATSYVPNMIAASDPNGRMTLIERFKNLISSLFMIGVFEYWIRPTYTDVFRRKYGADFPDFDDLFRKTQLYFINSDPFFEYARPTGENVIDVGGLTMKKAEPLDEHWRKIMDSAPDDGVVIFSLGSVANTTTMPLEIRLSFLNAFKRFPHFFVWKFEGDFPEAKSIKNVHLAKWLPQKDLMAHPKVKAAIIHGGYNSLTEITYTGLPVVVMPLWGDQYGNAARVTRQNIGVKLERVDLDEEKVYDALNRVLYDQRIRESAQTLGRMIREKPFSASRQAVEWLEYLAKFKRLDQLRPQSDHLYLFQYLLLDILVISLGILATSLLVIGLCVKFCLRKICSRGKTSVEQKKKRKGKGNLGKNKSD